MHRNKFFLLLGALIFIANGAVGCRRMKDSNFEVDIHRIQKPNFTEEKRQKISEESGFDIFRKLAIGNKENVFISPYSISEAFAMLYCGANGETAQQMQNIFGFSSDITTIGKQYKNSDERLINSAKNSGTILDIANSIRPNISEPILPSYLQHVEYYFRGSVVPENYFSDAAGAVKRMNQWVEDQTNNKIKDILRDVDRDTALVLLNAVYFKADWLYPFNPSLTSETLFIRSADKTVEVSTMHMDADVSYFENDSVTGIELPYKDNEFSMIFIMPKYFEGMNDLLEKISYHNLQNWKKSATSVLTRIMIPKFTMKYKVDLVEILPTMGMPYAFNPSDADFSGINGKKNLAVTTAVHQTFLEVDEKGSEAAAVTGIVLGRGAIPTPQKSFTANRPFLLVICSKDAKDILFIGLVNNPIAQ